jgi:hypothetical protein
MNKRAAYSVETKLDKYCVVDEVGAQVANGRYEATRLTAALMNGDYRAVAAGTENAAAECWQMLMAVLRPLRGVGQPALPITFPLL